MANRNRLTSNTVAEERRRRRRVSKDAPGGANEMQAGPSFETRCSASLLRTRRWGWRHWLARISLVVTRKIEKQSPRDGRRWLCRAAAKAAFQEHPWAARSGFF